MSKPKYQIFPPVLGLLFDSQKKGLNVLLSEELSPSTSFELHGFGP